MATVKAHALTEGGRAKGARAHNETANQVNQEHLKVEEKDFSHPLCYLLGLMYLDTVCGTTRVSDKLPFNL